MLVTLLLNFVAVLLVQQALAGIGVPSALVAVIEGLTMLFVLAATVRRA